MSASFHRTAWRFRALALWILTVCSAYALVVAGFAYAGEPRPLGIARFSLQTTKSVELPDTQEKLEEGIKTRSPVMFSHESYGFENQARAFPQAGGHPNGQNGGADALTATIGFETEQINAPLGPAQVPTRDPKDIVVSVPSGLLGNPAAVPRCPLKQVLSFSDPCPASTQVGVAVVHYELGIELLGPIVNVAPEAGQSAEFAIENNLKVNFLMTGHVVRGPDGYGLTVASYGTPNSMLTYVETTFWGVPASEVHDAERGLFCSRGAGQADAWQCGGFGSKVLGLGDELSQAAEGEVPFLTMPSDCTAGSEIAHIRVNSWQEPGQYVEKQADAPLPTITEGPQTGFTGCNRLQFEPGIRIEPDILLADAPVGLGVNLTVPQFEEPQRLATPEMRRAMITLPPGMSVSPGIVDGIQACNAARAEGEAIEIPTGRSPDGEPLRPGELGEGEEFGLNGEPQLAPGHCPDASIVGTVKATTPLLREPVEGHIYLARPNCGNQTLGQRPCTEQDVRDGGLYQLYLELGGKGSLADTGVNIKVRLKTEANPATGQLTAVTEEIAQLPFSKLEVNLNGGPRAPLGNPLRCGTAETTTDFAPWASPGITPQGESVAGVPDATPSSLFNVDMTGDGLPTACPNLRLSPGFIAGTRMPDAGQFSSFTMNVSRKDREQYIKGVQVHTPRGLLAKLSGVPLCPEPAADLGACSASSKIGTTRVASGAGSHPFEIEGNIYLTGPHDGAPFGLSVVTHVVAGPFNLGLVVVRARIDIDPNDSSATITTDETGNYALPQIIYGVPLRLQRITVDIDRPRFMFNPTNCAAQQVTASISGNQNVVADVASPFAAGNCKGLAFKPSFRVSTSGRTSRKSGASLDAKLTFPADAMGKDANIARVMVSLPRQLPSYLPTLQKACLAAMFDANPAACPSGSIVGIARANTPLLPNLPRVAAPCVRKKHCPRLLPPTSVEGPVYFVSHGGEKFPSLIIVLQGDGVRVDLTGATFISKAGITSSAFRTVPDVPVKSFELYLPQGKNHALAANANLCKVKGDLEMPSEFVAQNNAVIKQATQITVSGCGKPKTKKSQRLRRQGK